MDLPIDIIFKVKYVVVDIEELMLRNSFTCLLILVNEIVSDFNDRVAKVNVTFTEVVKVCFQSANDFLIGYFDFI